MKATPGNIAKLVIWGIVVIGVTILCVVRWNVWFGNIPEEPYIPQEEPHNILVSYDQDANSSRIISWRADTIKHYSYLLLIDDQGDTTTYQPTDTLVYSRAGKGVYYRVHLKNLAKGSYRYQIISNNKSTDWYSFSVKPTNDVEIVVFGDVQDQFDGNSAQMFEDVDSLYPDADCWAFVGDIIERPMDSYWQYWFQTMGNITTYRPIIAATGNHEHLKGVFKILDSRWPHVFGNPHNGPSRQLGTSYYIDFENLRFIVINTDGLNRFSDYTIASAWLRKVSEDKRGKKWNILMLHHPIHSTCVGRENVVLSLMMRGSLKNIDIVLQGHDHSYARRLSRVDSVATTPVFIETTSANKYYLSKVNPADDRILSAHPVYNIIDLNSDTLDFRTFMVENHTLYDQVQIIKNNSNLQINDLVPNTPEIIDLPDRYQGKNNSKVRRFHNRRKVRQAEWEAKHSDIDK